MPINAKPAHNTHAEKHKNEASTIPIMLSRSRIFINRISLSMRCF